jgi:anti-anti-sigma factor
MGSSGKVFDIEVDGGTLIVVPLGDALGFQESQIVVGINKLHQRIEDPAITHLVVDLSGATYLGSIIISALMTLAVKVRDSGGHAVICNASEGMHDIIKITRLDVVLPYYETRREAMESLAD